ncbi:MAG: hypothetical protein HQK72_16445 [Desulfamplus sp.]|nr:hypothetical protein [Desulfamplus sp.]
MDLIEELLDDKDFTFFPEELLNENGAVVGVDVEFISGSINFNWFDIASKIQPYIKKGDIDSSIKIVINELKEIPDTPFHNVVNCKFRNSPEEIADYITEFIEKERERIDIKSVYIEMNDFDINPDIWFFDLFAYKIHGGHDDYDWLSNWHSDNYSSITLAGAEELQKIYENYENGKYEEEENEEDYSNARDLASLLIVLYFQKLIKEAAALIDNLQIPILATAHGYDLIYEYDENY